MRLSFLLLALSMLLGQSQLFAQTCRQVDVATTPQKNVLLSDYIHECRQNRYFFEDKGAVKLIIYQDSDGVTCWYLSAIVDDRYRELPPEQYAFFDNDVILIYQGDSAGKPRPIAGDPTSRDGCIQDILGSRVYEHSTKKQFVFSHDANGKIQKIPVTRLSGGGLHNDLIIKFNKNGTVSKLIPV